MPAAFSLDDVPLGRWAEYEEMYLGTVTIKERVALVAKGSDGNTLETTTELKREQDGVRDDVRDHAGRWRARRQ